MRKLLTIGIPYYGETESEILPLLQSIDTQLGIDFEQLEVIIVDDKSPNPLISVSTFDFENISNSIFMLTRDENGGPGLARQTALDSANGRYIMFCDADDRLYSSTVLYDFFNVIEQKSPNCLQADWIEELKVQTEEGKKTVFVEHLVDTTWFHGKVFNVEFLNRNKISFHPNLRVHEDTYFIGLAYRLCGEREYIKKMSYIWTWKDDSITRRNNGLYTYDSFVIFLEAVEYMIDSMFNRKMSITEDVAQVIIYTYFNLQNPSWHTEETKEYLLQVEDKLGDLIVKYFEVFSKTPNNVFINMYNTERNKINNAGFIESEAYSQFINRIFQAKQKQLENKPEEKEITE